MTKIKIARVFQGCDLAISTKTSADYFCLSTIGISEGGKTFVLDTLHERGVSFHNQIGYIIQKAAEWGPLRIGVENNSYQAVMINELERLTLLPVVPITTIRDKITRAHARSALVETHRLYVAHGMHDLISEFVMLSPDGSSEHDDFFDSIDLALTAAETGQQATMIDDYYVPEFEEEYTLTYED